MQLLAIAAVGLFLFAGTVPAPASSTPKPAAKPAATHGKPEAKPADKAGGHGAKPAAHAAPAAHAPKPEPPKPAPPPAQIPRTPKPSPLAKPVAAPVRSSWSAPKRAATPAPLPVAPLQLAPIPVKVEVVQEAAPPTRVEAVLHVVPHYPGASPASSVKLPAGATHVEVPVNFAAWQGAAQSGGSAQRSEPPAAAARPSSAPSPISHTEPPPLPIRIPQKNLITNEGLVTLARAGYDEDFLIDLMRIKRCRFDTSVEGLAYLAGQGISERLVKAALRLESQSRSE